MKKYKLYNVLKKVFFIVILPIQSFAQFKQPSNVSIIPPSPNVSALNKYIDIPVNTYTGIPSINIPLYEIKVGNFTIPISLNYHAGGHKVEDIATWVGLGWSLTGVYQISRSLVGLMDESSNGFMNASEVLDHSPSTQDQAAYQKVKRYLDLEEDSEPDIFYVNTNTSSGKFLFDKETKRPNFIPHQKVKLNYSIAHEAIQTWTLLNTEGIKYLFDKKETINISPVNQRGPTTSEGNSTWWVSQIEFPDSDDRISYEYNSSTISYLQGVSHTSFYNLSPSTISKPDIESHNRITTEILLPRIIHFPGGKIEFIVNSPTDFQRCDVMGGKYLKEIIVKNDYGVVVKHFSFNYSYFSNDGDKPLSVVCVQGQERDNIRLKLNSVTDITQTIQPITTTFKYEESVNLPNRITSFARDHWGFYNGVESNYTLVPETKTFIYNGIPISLDGANRLPSSLHSKANVLKQINYPTGGKSLFTYELNDCENDLLPNEFVFRSTTAGIEIIQTPKIITVETQTWQSKVEIRPFYLPENGTLKIDFFHERDNRFIESRTYVNKRGNVDPLNPFYINVGTYGLKERYRIECSYIGDELNPDYDLIGISWKDEILKKKKQVGGLRVKSVELYDSIYASKLTSIYSYNDVRDSSLSSGAILQVPFYEYIYHYNWAHFLARTSIPNTDLGFSQGSPVGYKFVTVKQIDIAGNINGMTEFEYTNATDHPDEYTTDYFDNPVFLATTLNNRVGFPFVRASHQNEWRRGQLLSKKIYKGSQSTALTLVAETKNIYKTYGGGMPLLQFDSLSVYAKAISAAKAYVIFEFNPGGINTDVRTVVLAGYKIHTGWYSELIETSDKDFRDNIVMTTTKRFEYDSVTFQHRKIEVYDSKNEKVVTEFLYPTDIHNDITDSMVNRNMLSAVIQQSLYRDNQQIRIEKSNFQFNNNRILLSHIDKSISGNPFQRVVTYEKYSNNGNLLQYTESNGVKNSFIWGYESLLPIAQITNSEQENTAFSSFETTDRGNWEYDNAGLTVQHGGITGNKSYNLLVGNIQRSGLQSETTYLLSYWLKDETGSVNIGGAVITSKNGWKLYQKEITGNTNIYITGNGIIDELRLHPVNAQMLSYTYEPLIGMTSQCDTNNRITYYEYDSLGRLKFIRDQDRNIIKTFNYNYQQ